MPNDESVDSIKLRLKDAEADAIKAPEAIRLRCELQAELDRINGELAGAQDLGDKLRGGRPGGNVWRKPSVDSTAAILEEFAGQKHRVQQELRDLRGNEKTLTLPEKIRAELAEAIARDKAIAPGFLDKALLRRVGQERAWPMSILITDLDFLQHRIRAETPGAYRATVDAFTPLRAERWADAVKEMALWVAQNAVSDAALRPIIIYHATGKCQVCALYRVVRHCHGAESWRIHTVAYALFLPFSTADVQAELRRIGVRVHSAMIDDGRVMQIGVDGRLTPVVQTYQADSD